VGDLLRYGAECGFPDNWADDLLADASREGDLMTVIAFVNCSDIDRKIDGDRTALMHASANGQFHLVKYLVEENAETGTRDRNGKTAAEIAVENNHEPISGYIVASQSELWGSVCETEKWVHDLQHERISNGADEIELLATPEFSELNSKRIDVPLIDNELMWFRATESISIGMYHNGGFTWMINGTRVPDVW